MTYIIEVFAYQRLQVTCSNFKIAVSSPILPGETGLSDILMIYSKEILSGIAWKGYLLHAGRYMRRNGWMVGIQLETLGPFERSYSFGFSRPALVNGKCSGRAMWLPQRSSRPPYSLLSHENPRRLVCKENEGTSSQDLTEKSFLTNSGMRQNQGNYILSRHLWCRDSDSTWLKQPQLHNRSPTRQKLTRWKLNAKKTQHSGSEHRRGVKVGWLQRRGFNPSWLPPFIHLTPALLEPALCKLG